MDRHILQILLTEGINEDLYYVAVLKGRRCRSFKSFLKRIGKAFKFPSYYGMNLNALNECLNDLEWIEQPNYLLIIEDKEVFLNKESEEMRAHIFNFLERVSKQWANVPNYLGDEYRQKADFRIIYK
jgi:RNAse (barnase) inhibitor barstar